MDTKKLRQKILDLAIRGKLVPQDPNDEPASVLLERIKEEKERLIKEGKIKKSKKTVSSDTYHYPYLLPKGWEWCRLGDINDIARGGSPRPIKDYLTDEENGINWIKIGDTTKDGKYINSVKEKIKPEGAKKSRMVHKGDFLLTNSMSFGRPYILNVDGCIHDGWLVISPIGNAYTTDFLYYLLSSAFAFEQFANAASGGVVTNLNSDKVADTYFPIPPLVEQIRIVTEIEHWFVLIDIIEQGKRKLQISIKQVKNKILDLAIHGKLVPQDPNDEPASELLKRINPKAEITSDNEHYENLPRTWCICKLNAVVNIVNGKTQKEVKDVNGVYPIYGSGGIIGYAKEYLCLSGSTIIGRKGTINNPILVNENFWNVDTAFGMKPIDIVDDAYFFYFCQSFDFSQLDKSTALPSLTKTVIGNLLLPVPPYNEQKRIVTVIRRYEQILNTIEESL